MSRRLICFVSYVLVLGFVLADKANAADPSLVGWWKFDEGSGIIAADSSGNGNDGAFNGNPTWVDGKFGKALHFDGVDDFVEVPHADILTVDTEVTVMAWINPERRAGPGSGGYQGILGKSNNPRSYSFYTAGAGTLHFSSVGTPVTTSNTILPLNEWTHVAAMVADGSYEYYTNGNYDGGGLSGVTLPGQLTRTALLSVRPVLILGSLVSFSG